MASAPTKDPASVGVIDPERFYTFKAIEQIIGIGRAGIRAARRNGLKVRYLGRQGFVSGKDLIDHILTTGKTDRA